MAGYIGTKAALLSTTTASVGGDSTVGGDLTVDTNTLYVDSTNNRVGIGTSSVPAAAKAMVSGGRFYVNSQDQYSVLLQNGGTSGGFIGTTGGDTINFFSSSGTERMRIDSAGRVTMPYQPAFLGRDLGTIPTSSGIYTNFGTIDHNRGNHYNNSTGAFTCPVSGVYFFWANVRTNDNLSGRDESTRFVVNGSFQTWTEVWEGETYDASSGRAGHVNVMTMYLNTGDYVQLHLVNDTAMHAAFGGYLIG